MINCSLGNLRKSPECCHQRQAILANAKHCVCRFFDRCPNGSRCSLAYINVASGDRCPNHFPMICKFAPVMAR
jgi:hypothetical protein